MDCCRQLFAAGHQPAGFQHAHAVGRCHVLAARQHKTIGEVISALSREALKPSTAPGKLRNGVPLLPGRAGASAVTPELELVNQPGDELP
jgi:hypothetical protein